MDPQEQNSEHDDEDKPDDDHVVVRMRPAWIDQILSEWPAQGNGPELTVEEIAQLEGRLPTDVADEHWARAAEMARQLLAESPRQVALNERLRKIETARARVIKLTALLDDRADIEALQRNAGRDVAQLEPFWESVSARLNSAKAELGDAPDLSTEPTHAELTWATQRQRIGLGIVGVIELPSGPERNQALSVARQSDLVASTRPDSVEMLLRSLQRIHERGELDTDRFEQFVRFARDVLTSPRYGGTLATGLEPGTASLDIASRFGQWAGGDYEGLLRRGLEALGVSAEAARDLFAFLAKRVKRQ